MKAIIAVAASMLTNGCEYQDLGHAHVESRDSTNVAKRLVARLENLGYKVTVDKAA